MHRIIPPSQLVLTASEENTPGLAGDVRRRRICLRQKCEGKASAGCHTMASPMNHVGGIIPTSMVKLSKKISPYLASRGSLRYHGHARGVSILLSFLFIFPAVCFAQSTLEYTSLLTAEGGVAAGTSKKEKKEGAETGQTAGLAGGAMKGVYGDTGNTLLKGSQMLRQVGGGVFASEDDAQSLPAGTDVDEAKFKSQASTDMAANTLVKVRLRSGQVIQGNLVEKTPSHIKLEAAGVVVTYFSEEVASIAPAYGMTQEAP